MVMVIGKDKNLYKQITCKNCASILEYVNNEVKRYDGVDYSGGADGKEWIKCPSCNKQVIIRSW